MTNTITKESTVQNTDNKELNPLLVQYLNELDQKEFIDFIIEKTDVEAIDYLNELDHFRLHGWCKSECPEPTLEEYVWKDSEQILEKYHQDLNDQFHEFVLDAMIEF
jgi:hypothetical protein